MKQMIYSLSGWREVEMEPFFDDDDDERDLNAYLSARGYEKALDFPAEQFDMFGDLSIWRGGEKATAFPYLVMFSWEWTAGQETFWCDSFPAMLSLLSQQLLPCTQAMAMAQTIEHMTKIVQKAFHAWHGHDEINMCIECDPQGMQAMRTRRTAKQAQKNHA
jgi:hypothetical protein